MFVLGGKGLFGVLIVSWVSVATLAVLGWLGLSTRVRQRRGHRGGRPTPSIPVPVVISVVAAVGVGLCLAGLRLGPLVSEPVTSMGAQHAVGDIEARIDAPPRLSRAAAPSQSWVGAADGASRNWSAPATLTTVREAGHEWTMSVPVLLVGSVDGSADLHSLTPGTTITAAASLREADPSRGTALLVRVRGSPAVVGQPPWWQAVASHVRDSMRVAAAQLPSDERGLLPGLVVGDESGLSEDLRESMQQTGLSHLTAVSGANLAVITGLVLGVALLFRVRRWVAVLAAGAALLGFVVIVGPQPSVLRAALMGLVALLALVTGRRRVGFSALAVSAVALLLIDPWMSVSMGFALSVAATGGLLLYAAKSSAGPPGLVANAGHRSAANSSLEAADFDVAQSGVGQRTTALIGGWLRLKHRVKHGIRLAFGVAVAAQLATLPLVASFGNGVPTVGVVANLLAEPAVPFATILGCAAALVASVAPVGGPPLAHIAGFATWWIASVARWCSDLPAGLIPWPAGFLGFVLGCGLVAALIVTWSRRAVLVRTLQGNPRGSMAVAAALIAFCAAFRSTGQQWPPPGWLMVACDVGQGDALVIATGPGRAMVVDAGPAGRQVDRCLSGLGVHNIDLLVLSHFHADHVDGLDGAIADRGVGSVIVSPLSEPPLQYRNVASALADRAIPVRLAEPGEEGVIGSVRYRVLWPTQLLRGPGSAPNNASVTLAIDVGDPPLRMLLTGDLEPPAQQALLSAQPGAPFDVVKVPHHGSRNQSGDLAARFPAAVAVISVGTGNRYGHPAASTIADWERHGARVVRTDQFGDIAVGREPDQDIFVVGHGPRQGRT